MLADFAENYSFVVQDKHKATTGTNNSAFYIQLLCMQMTVIKFVKPLLCFISDDLSHDTGFVYALQKVLSGYVQSHLPHIQNMECFSDGCSGQYKNYKNFLNLTYHKHDFDVNASWVFLPRVMESRHVMAPVACWSENWLRKFNANKHLWTAKSVFKFCEEPIHGITKFFHPGKEHLIPVCASLTQRFATGNTIPGTRSFHHFTPDSVGRLMFKRTSQDNACCGTHSFFKPQFLACTYDNQWWIGLVE